MIVVLLCIFLVVALVESSSNNRERPVETFQFLQKKKIVGLLVEQERDKRGRKEKCTCFQCLIGASDFLHAANLRALGGFVVRVTDGSLLNTGRLSAVFTSASLLITFFCVSSSSCCCAACEAVYTPIPILQHHGSPMGIASFFFPDCKTGKYCVSRPATIEIYIYMHYIVVYTVANFLHRTPELQEPTLVPIVLWILYGSLMRLPRNEDEHNTQATKTIHREPLEQGHSSCLTTRP